MTSLASPASVTIPPQPDWVPFLRLFGAVQEKTEGGLASIHLPELRDELCNQLTAAHAGVVMTLLDVAMARSATSLPGAPSNTAVTVEMSSRFMHPGRGPLVAEGRVIGRGCSMCTCEA